MKLQKFVKDILVRNRSASENMTPTLTPNPDPDPNKILLQATITRITDSYKLDLNQVKNKRF